MAVTRIKNNQITDASAGNVYVGIDASTKLQAFSITAGKIANNLTYGSNLTITGNLTVDGTTTAINTVNTIIEDPLIVLADGQTSGSPTVDIGVIGLRGSELSSVMAWKESQKEFVFALSNTDVGGTSFSNTTFNINQYADLRTGNLAVTGVTSLTGNVVGTNTNFDGNITAANFIGNISGNLVISGGNTDVLFNDNGVANSTSQFRFDKAANLVTMTGALSVAGTATTGNLATAGTVSATGNIIGGNIITSGAGGDISGTGNIFAGGTISATGTITGGNLATGGTASAGGNVTGANFGTAGIVSATGDIFGANFTAAGNIIPATNVTYDIGNTTARWNHIYAQGPITLGNLQIKESPANTFTVTQADGVTPANVALGPLSVAGNVDGGNLRTTGQVSATGTITGGNIDTAGTASVAGTATVGNLATGGTVSATGNIVTADYLIANNAIFSQNVSLAGNVTVFNVNVLGRVSANGNVIGSNLITSGAVSATGTATVGNVATGGTVSATGDVTGANLLTGGTVSATGTITGGNVATAGTVSATGTITSANTITGGNVATGGTVSATGTVTGGNVDTGGTVSATGTITGGNVATGGTVSATGTITGGNVDTAGTVSATGTVTGGNVATGGTVSATGTITSADTITGGNVATGGTVSATGTVTGGNVDTGGTISATGTITSANTITGGNIATAGTVSAGGNITGGNVLTGGLISATGNITGGNVNAPQIYNATGLTITNGSGNINLQPAGNVVMANTFINGVALPVQDQDAASKQYVDNLVSTNISYHEAVIAATTTDLDTATGGTVSYNQPNGAGNGQGAYLQTTGSFTTIDTANIQTVGTRILVKDEANAAWNGIYVYSNTTAIVRSTSEDTAGVGNAFALGLNDYFFTTGGNINQGTAFVVDAPTTPIVFGTSNISFAIFSQSPVYTANTQAGLSLVGTVFSAKVDDNTTAFDGGGNIIVKASANLTTPNIGAATGTSLSTTGTITGGNLDTGGTVSATGTITGGNVNTSGNISATGNVIAANFVGNIQGNIASPGANTQVIFNDNGTANATSGFTFDKTTNTATAGNLATGGTVTATGTITGGNVATGGTVSATGNITGGNAIATGGFFDNVSVTANVVTGNLITSGTGGNITGGGNIIVSGYISTTSSVVGANLQTGGNVSATGTVTGGNVATGGNVSATGTVTGGNVVTSGSISATGTATVGNVATGGSISATGNITTAAWLVAPDAAIGNISLTGNVAANNITATGFASITGNVIGGNIDTSGLVSATGTVTGGNLATGGTVSATGTVTGGNVDTGGTISAVGTITGGNVVTGGIVSAVGDVTGGNVSTGGKVSATGNVETGGAFSATGNVQGGNILTTGFMSATGNVTAANFFGNISGNLSAPGANTNVIFNDNGTANATAGFTFDKTSNAVVITGNITGANLFTGGEVSATGNITGGNFDTAANVSATGNVTGGNLVSTVDIVSGGFIYAPFGDISAGGNIIGINLVLTTGIIDGPAAGTITVNGSSIDTDFAVNGQSGANILYIDAGTGTASFGNSTQTVNSIVSFNATNSIVLPVGNTAQRPTGVTGQFRFNSSLNSLEVYDNNEWIQIGATEYTLITDQQFAGDGSTLVFTLSGNSTTAGTIVSINGVQQIPTTAYAVTNNILTFTEAPEVGDNIDVRVLLTTTEVNKISNSAGNAEVSVSDLSNVVTVSSNLFVTGTASVTGNVTALNFVNSSDATLKTHIQPIVNAAQVIDALSGVGYDWIDGSGHAYGLIAQAVEQVIPEAVVTAENGIKAVNYNMLIPFLIERSKQQSQEIAELKDIVYQLLAR